jgi:hypothetical protein
VKPLPDIHRHDVALGPGWWAPPPNSLPEEIDPAFTFLPVVDIKSFLRNIGRQTDFLPSEVPRGIK